MQALSAESKVQIGDDFIGFTAVDINNKPAVLDSASKSKKIIFLLSTTCPYCKKQNAYWTELLNTFDASRYEVLAVFNRKEELKTVDEYFETFGYKNTVTPVRILFSEGETLDKYKLKSTPTTLVIDENDRVEKAWIGLWSPLIISEANSFFNTSIAKKES
jgi:thiol-disulfide isomerase/thioredoxin